MPPSIHDSAEVTRSIARCVKFDTTLSDTGRGKSGRCGGGEPWVRRLSELLGACGA